MASLFSTGPVDIFFRHPADNTVEFLGHGERAPTIEEHPFFVPVKCDLSGEAPIDEIYAGSTFSVSCTLVRFDWENLDFLRARPRSASYKDAEAGTDRPGQIGTLMRTEGANFELFLRFPNAGKAAFNTMESGYHFYSCYLDPDSFTGGSAQNVKAHVVFQCRGELDAAAFESGKGYGEFSYYDHDLSACQHTAIS